MKFTPEQETNLRNKIEMSHKTLVAFRSFLLTNGKDDVESAPFHFDWSDILLKEKHNFAIEGYRESAKGNYVLRAYPLHCLMFPSELRDYIVLIKQNATLAGAKLLEIEEEYLSNPVLRANLVQVKQKSSEVFSVIVKDKWGNEHNIRIEAYGKGSSIRGLANLDRRPRICVIDDPQDTEDAKSDTVLENDWQWFISDVMFLGQKTRIFLIGNNLGEKCIVERVFNSANELGFNTRRVSILNDQGQPSWPEKFPIEFIEKERESYRNLGMIDVWMRERMCQATSEESRTFNLKDFSRYSGLYIDSLIKDTNIFATLDPASSKADTSCFRAIVVNAVTPDNRWIICDIPYGRWDSAELIDKIFDTVVKWTPHLDNRRRLPFGIEKGIFKQVLEPFIYKEMQRRNIFFDILPIEHAREGTKLERVKMLAPRSKAHTIMLPEQASWLGELENELCGVTKDGFKSLYVDLIDALAMQQQIAQPPVASVLHDGNNGYIEQTGEYNPFTHRSGKQIEVAGDHSPLVFR